MPAGTDEHELEYSSLPHDDVAELELDSPVPKPKPVAASTDKKKPTGPVVSGITPVQAAPKKPFVVLPAVPPISSAAMQKGWLKAQKESTPPGGLPPSPTAGGGVRMRAGGGRYMSVQAVVQMLARGQQPRQGSAVGNGPAEATASNVVPAEKPQLASEDEFAFKEDDFT
jgi:hypothetical protein